MSALQQPPAPTWWEQQWFSLLRREQELAAEEAWLQQERTRFFPERCQRRAEACQQQEAELLQHMGAASKQGRFANLAWVLTGVGRPALSGSQQAHQLANALLALRNEYKRQEARDREWLERRERELALKCAQLQADRQAFAALMQQYHIVLP
jgi:hypothetical protein